MSFGQEVSSQRAAHRALPRRLLLFIALGVPGLALAVAATLVLSLYPYGPERFLQKVGPGYGYNGGGPRAAKMARRFHHGAGSCARYADWWGPTGFDLSGSTVPGVGGICAQLRADPDADAFSDVDLGKAFDQWNDEIENAAHARDYDEEELIYIEEQVGLLDRVRIAVNRVRLLRTMRPQETEQFIADRPGRTRSLRELDAAELARLRALWKRHPLGPAGCRLMMLAQ